MPETSHDDSNAAMRRALKVIEKLEAKVRGLEAEKNDPIAIVGLACRFPGADSPEEFWQLLVDGRETITDVPADRFGDWGNHRGGFIRGADQFDAKFWGISPREATSMDPQQRLLLEIVHDALERGGQSADMIRRSQTGMFLAISASDYAFIASSLTNSDPFNFATGNGKSFTSGRVSYALELSGPSMAIDTACSSSLVAIDLACQSLRLHTSDMAIAAGVTLNLSPEVNETYSKAGVTSPGFRCRTFDAGADGYARSEGCGAVILKRLSDAHADGDPILAVIRGSAVNQNGGSASVKAPNPVAQAAVLRKALAVARVTPAQVSYVETHGSGTMLGDAIELQALQEVLGAPTPAGTPCLLASVKTNIGHMETAAGMAGIIKVVLALQNEMIPPHLHFRRLSPNISFEGTRFEIPLANRPWKPGGAPRVAGVSAFGMSGTNAHVILEEAPRIADEVARPAGPYILSVSARGPEALRALAQRYAERFSERSDAWLGPACYTANVRRAHHEYRLALVARDCAQVSEALRAFVRGDARPESRTGVVTSSRRKTTFAFPGRGSGWPSAARALMAGEPAFRAAVEACDAAIVRAAGVPASVLEWTETAALDARSLFAFQVGLAALWRARGVEPHAVVGEGAGEIAAAHVAGALLLDDAARLVCARATLMLGVPTRAAAEAAMSQARPSGARAEVTIPIYSTVTGQIVAADKLDAAYWARNAVEGAQLGPTIDHLASEGYDVFVELAPEPVIGPHIERTLANAGERGGVVQTLRADRSERDAILDAIAHLETLGCRVDWSRQYPRGLRPTDLPTYAWQRERFWSEDAPEPRAPKQNGSSTSARGDHHEAAATGGE